MEEKAKEQEVKKIGDEEEEEEKRSRRKERRGNLMVMFELVSNQSGIRIKARLAMRAKATKVKDITLTDSKSSQS